MHALLGPDAPLPLHLHSPREPMPMQPPVLQPPLPVHVGHVFGGLHGATVGSAMQGLVHAGYGGGRDAQGGADGGGLGGGMAGLELDPEMADAVLVGSDEQWSSGQGTIEGDTFGTEVRGVCVCVACARKRSCMVVRQHVCVPAHVRACMCACARACLNMCSCVFVCSCN